eukprot:12898307-Prorocentrum_lima.AAC.1
MCIRDRHAGLPHWRKVLWILSRWRAIAAYLIYLANGIIRHWSRKKTMDTRLSAAGASAAISKEQCRRLGEIMG